MAFTGVMPAVDLIAPRYGLEAGATVIKHGEDQQTWGSGFQQENGLCGVRGEFWAWCGSGLAPVPQADYDLDDPPDGVDPDTSAFSVLAEGDTADGRWEQVYPFLVQAEDTCLSPLSARRPDTKQHLLDVLEFLSIKGAERELWVGAAHDDAKRLTDADLVAEDLPPKVALGVVEEAMAACMPGVQGTIHIPPALASVLDNSLQDVNGELWTFAGSRVIVGAGYAGQTGQPTPPAVDYDYTTSAIYGTGPVIVHLGPTSMVTEELAQMANVARNEFHLRAERLVAVTFDGCCHVGATVSLT